MANPPSTISLLNATFSPHPTTVLTAENELHAREFRPSFLTELFQISISKPNNPNDAAIAQAASIYLKNLIRRAWHNVNSNAPSESPSFLAEPDRNHVRAHIVPALVTVNTNVRTQLSEALKRIISADFPLHFPHIIDHIMAGLSSSDPNTILGALIALRALAKVYEFKSAALDNDDKLEPHHKNTAAPDADLQYLHDHPRAALNYLVKLSFPSLLRIMLAVESALDTVQPHSLFQLQLHIQRVICKIFWSFTQYDLPIYFLSDLSGVFSEWMNVFLNALRRPVKPVFTIADQPSGDDLYCMPQWKVKQWIIRIVSRLFQRYSNPSQLNPAIVRKFDLPTLTAFGDFFRRNFAGRFTAVMLDIVATDQRLISPRVANFALSYLEAAVPVGLTYKVIKPTLEPLITNVLFPYICISDADLELWNEDPVEYVRKTYNILEDFNTPRTAACALLSAMTRSRKSSVIPLLFNFLVRVLEDYATFVNLRDVDPNCEERKKTRYELARRKEGALHAIGTIRGILVTHPEGEEQLVRLLDTHVMHEVDSDIPFLRARACWLYGQFAAAGNLPSDVLFRALQGMQRRLCDDEFPVRVRAAVDIRHFVQNARAVDALAPYLPDLMHMLFSMLDDVDSTDIVATIDQLALRFSNHIIGFAPELCHRLVLAFSRAASAGQGDEEANFAAGQCLQALASIVMSVNMAVHKDKVQLLADIEKTISVVFDHMFDEDRIEHFEDALELLATFVYYTAEERAIRLRELQANGVDCDSPLVVCAIKDGGVFDDKAVVTAMKADVSDGGGIISPYLWSLFSRSIDVFHGWAMEYSTQYLQLIDAYLSMGMHVLVLQLQDGRQKTYVGLLMDVIARLWDDGNGEVEDRVLMGGHLFGLFLRHCRRIGRQVLDAEVDLMTELVVKRLRSGQLTDDMSTGLIRALAQLLYMAPLRVLTIIDQKLGCTIEIFKMWMWMVQQNQLELRYDLKVSVIALSAIFACDWSTLPSAVRESIPQLMLANVSLLELLGEMDRKKHAWLQKNDKRAVDRNSTGSNGGKAGRLSGGGQEGIFGINEDDDDGDTIVDMEESRGEEGEDEDESAEEEEIEYCGRKSYGFLAQFYAVDDLDELLYFESVVRRWPGEGWQQLSMALAKADTLRVESALHRAAEVRNIAVHNMNNMSGDDGVVGF